MNIRHRMTSAAKLATDEIRSMIFDGSLAANERVSIEQLSRELGVSRTPVREAAQRLQMEGLIEIIPRVGVHIREITLEEASGVYEIKRAIEPLAAEWAARRSADEARARLGPILSEMNSCRDQGDVSGYTELVAQFHAVVMELARNPALQAIWSVISPRVHQLRSVNLDQPARIARSYENHEAIAFAIWSGDGDAAFESMATHVDDAHASALNALREIAVPSAGS